MAIATLDIVRVSATTPPAPGVRAVPQVAKLIDISTCIGCKACEVACLEWNDLRRSRPPRTASTRPCPTPRLTPGP